jgi:cytochrome bd-type quinol oxidase subunit 2
MLLKRLKLFIATLAVVLCLTPAVSAVAATQLFQGACSAPGSQSSTACQQDGSDPLTGEKGILTRATRLLSFLTGVVAVIMLIIAGIMFVTSDGDASKVASARQTALYALIGVIVALVAQGIVVFVLSRI